MDSKQEILPGEITDPAADGTAVRPAIRSFSQFISFLEGNPDHVVNDELKKVVRDCADEAASTKDKVKGKVTLTVTIEADGDAIRFDWDAKATYPKHKAPRTTGWPLQDGTVSPYPPRQNQLFGVRDANSGPRATHTP